MTKRIVLTIGFLAAIVVGLHAQTPASDFAAPVQADEQVFTLSDTAAVFFTEARPVRPKPNFY